jgi:hypothetical protein
MLHHQCKCPKPGAQSENYFLMLQYVFLQVDSVEGPMPQTRFVLKKALELGQRVVVVVNKIDRPSARPAYVVDTTFELFCDLKATDEQVREWVEAAWLTSFWSRHHCAFLLLLLEVTPFSCYSNVIGVFPASFL